MIFLRPLPLLLSFALLSAVSSHGAQPKDSKPEVVSRTGGKGTAAPSMWESVEAMQKAADAGDTAATVALGERYLRGEDVSQDVARALELLERAAKAGNTSAAFRLGKLYDDGELVERNAPKAIEYYLTAARAGAAEAQHNLGALYVSARGVKRDYVEGLAWLILATKNGIDPASEQQVRERLVSTKRTGLIADAERRAAALLKEGSPSSGTDPVAGGISDARNAATRGDTKPAPPKLKPVVPTTPTQIPIQPVTPPQLPASPPPKS
jgi:uncharacterized protein